MKTALVAVSLIGAASVLPFSAGTALAASTAKCSTSVSVSRPRDYTTEIVRVATVKDASVTATAHYRTVNRTHTGRANAKGSASIYFYISGATPGYRVRVSVTVRSGDRGGSCSTSFTPRR
jgi:hypothetical protein